MRPHPTYWLARRYAHKCEYRAALVLDALRWPETTIPRTMDPADFTQLLHARGR